MNFQRIAEAAGRQVSCGVIFNDNGQLLACHPTGKRYGPMSYDIPKGCLEPGEDPRECAARELYEETSIVLSDSEKASMKDLGVVPYTSYKDLHLFYIESKIPDLKTLKCISTWDDNGTPRPEVNDFKKVSLDDLSLLFKSLQASIKTAFTKLN